jgi:hypothetical protein
MKCKECKKENPKSSYVWKSSTGGLNSSTCSSCREKHQRVLKRLRKLHTPPLDNKCNCCGKLSDRNLSLDHCHTTYSFRGWLCKECNMAIGGLGDDVSGVKKALIYLIKAEGNKMNIENQNSKFWI